MTNLIQSLLFFTVLAIVLYGCKVFFDRLSSHYAQKLEKIMRKMAEEYGLEYRQEEGEIDENGWQYPLIRGQVDGAETEVRIVEKGHGDDRNLYYEVEIRIQNPKNVHLELYLNNVMARGLWGSTDIDLEDKAFQKQFLVRSARPDILPQVLDDEMRRFILDRKRSFQTNRIQLRGNKITYHQYAFYQGRWVKAFKDLLDLMLKLAQKVDRL